MQRNKLPSSLELNESGIKRYFQFVNERHAVYIRRGRGDEWPWTKDRILQEYFFTNIYRELDTGTIYCRTKIREPYANHPELFFNIALYRTYNLIGTYEEIGYVNNFDPDHIKEILRSRKDSGNKVFTGSHMITGTGGGGRDKISMAVDLWLTPLWDNRHIIVPTKKDTLQSAFKRLIRCNGYGPFIGYEIITDLRHTRYLRHASDIMTWANPGNGAMRGVKRLYGIFVHHLDPEFKTKNINLPEEIYVDCMQMLLTMSPSYLEYWMPSMEIRDIEHSLCEWDKYERIRLQEGKMRRKFTPPHMR
jgi:hypothetical protein